MNTYPILKLASEGAFPASPLAEPQQLESHRRKWVASKLYLEAKGLRPMPTISRVAAVLRLPNHG